MVSWKTSKALRSVASRLIAGLIAAVFLLLPLGPVLQTVLTHKASVIDSIIHWFDPQFFCTSGRLFLSAC